jgi:hypothetical protein
MDLLNAGSDESLPSPRTPPAGGLPTDKYTESTGITWTSGRQQRDAISVQLRRFAQRKARPSQEFHSGFRIRSAPKRNANEPCARTARNELPCFPGHKTPPARNRAHRSHTSTVEIKIYWGVKRVLLIKESQSTGCVGSISAKRMAQLVLSYSLVGPFLAASVTRS